MNKAPRPYRLSILILCSIVLISVGTIEMSKTNMELNKVQPGIEVNEEQSASEGMFGVPSAGRVVYRLIDSMFPE